MGNFTAKLKKYYIKQGNKLVFKGGYSLNKLALTMWERLHYRGIDPGLLSRIVSGKRRFTLEQLNVFCDVLHIPAIERKQLRIYLEENILKSYGLSLEHEGYSILDLTDIIRDHVRSVAELRERGLLEQVISTSSPMIRSIRQLIRKTGDDKYKKLLYTYLAELYFEQGYTFNSKLLPSQNTQIRSLIAGMKQIAFKIQSKDIFCKANIVEAFSYYLQGYVKGNYSTEDSKKNSYLMSNKILDTTLKIGIEDRLLHLMLWRIHALNDIYLSKKNDFLYSQKQIDTIAASGDVDNKLSHIVWVYDSLARGQSIFNISSAIHTLEKAKSYSKLFIWRDPLRETSLIRNEVEVYKNLKTGDTHHINKLIARGALLSKEFSYDRYIKFFEHATKNM